VTQILTSGVMKVSYFHVAANVPAGPLPETAVVIDVLRATTTIAWALNNGAEAIQTFAELAELNQSASKWPEDSRLLIGERGGKKMDGFDFGNSPVDLIPEMVLGKRLFMSTTNGTRALQRVREVKNLYTLSLPNRKAIADQLLKAANDEVWIVGSGWEGEYSLEDSLGAGALAAFLLDRGRDFVLLGNDEIIAAVALWEKWKTNPEDCLRSASHGKRLIRLGNHDADFKCCSQLDNLSIVPKQFELGTLRAC